MKNPKNLKPQIRRGKEDPLTVKEEKNKKPRIFDDEIASLEKTHEDNKIKKSKIKGMKTSSR